MYHYELSILQTVLAAGALLILWKLYAKFGTISKQLNSLLHTQQGTKQQLILLQEYFKRFKQNAQNAHSEAPREASNEDASTETNGLDNFSTKLYIGNVDYSVTEQELEALFAPFGELEFVNIPVNRYTGKARGFGFVTFINPDAARNATTMDGSELKGRPLQVSFAKERA